MQLTNLRWSELVRRDLGRLRPARADEADELSGLAMRSKSHWGYSPGFLEACRAELAITPEKLGSGVTVADLDGRIVGFHRIEGSPPAAELAALFVDLDMIGAGVGGALLRDALSAAAERGIRRLVLDADPGAEPFYARYGAERIGQSPSGSVPGRVLPHMRFELG
ncbi:GNAT family N-acetyltransferase [Glycomyces xiaoerkulensis]|uniref:GNAT family N-acetyltransferase n=1 Tax=Glycomyces xiaoerkulensis TaxID=2038139 RepID=UPI001E4D28F1|nr:GNAT family N-acetyltransferase [Glycomyces xiaoerkulensis]